MSNPLLDLITQGESESAGYNAYNRGTYIDADGKAEIRSAREAIDFSQMTLEQVLDRQHAPRDSEEKLLAVGKYQIIPSTMSEAARKLDLDQDQAFTPALQDKIFSQYLIVNKRPEVHDYITGKPGASLSEAQAGLASEWASFGDPNKGGASHYPPPNHASITLAQSEHALNQMRTDYQADLAKGMTPAAAWNTVTASNIAPSRTGPAHDVTEFTRQHVETRHLLIQGAHGTMVRTLQEELSTLGYTDNKSHSLEPDSNFGTHTHDAVEAFQRDHHLKVDGKVGRDTQTALQTALPARTTSLDDPHHTDHPLYQQSLALVHRAESERGITPGLHSERVAAALVPAAKSEGITHIDRVLLSERGDRAYAEQKGSMPGINDKFAFVDTDKAIHTTIAQSTAALAQVNQQQHELTSINTQTPPAPTVEPAISGPVR